MFKRIAAAALAIALTAGPVLAQDPDVRLLGRQPRGIHFIDLASIAPDGKFKSVQLYVAFKPGQERDGAAYASVVQRIDCKGRRFMLLRIQEFETDGGAREPMDFETLSIAQWVEVPKGSAGGEVLSVVCDKATEGLIPVEDYRLYAREDFAKASKPAAQ